MEARLPENVQQQKQEVHVESPLPDGFLQKFRLYATRSNFYMVGRDKSRTHWKVINRLEPTELSIHEDTATYNERQCSDLLRRVQEGNRATGGLKFVTSCYGIIGFIKFLGPYYMILITKRRLIGEICGHEVYAVSKSQIIPLPSSSIRSKMVNNEIENRYKKLLCMIELTKDFYFSYSYNVMRSLQKNTCDHNSEPMLYETMFVWNEFLTRGIRNTLQSTHWTVALVYGFFKQVVLTLSGRDLKLILIARRSRHYAGTRYRRRGVNEKGRVANDVETEQILVEEVDESLPPQISSVVQNRGSIPLFWAQETSRLNLKPDIILSKRDQRYQATRLHFEDLSRRYANPIIVLNLVKTNEKKPRESILRAEFANAIEIINKDLPEENRLKFLHWDLHKHSKSDAKNVLILLGKVAAYALELTGFFYCQPTPALITKGHLKCASSDNSTTYDHSDKNFETHGIVESGDLDNSDGKSTGLSSTSNSDFSFKPPMLQKGVLRTNCIDCIDRTNVAQYVYGLAALGHQLHALGFTSSTKIDLDDPLAGELMGCYERMGDTLAHQYGGSAAHNKIFSERRGQWKAATHSQEFFRTLQRYYSNTYMDVEKQNAINIFLGHFQPQPGKPAIWELDSDQHLNIGRNGESDENAWSLSERSLSDGHILHENRPRALNLNINRAFSPSAHISHDPKNGKEIIYGSSPVLPIPEKEFSNSRYSHTTPSKESFTEMQREQFMKQESMGSVDFSNFVDLDWLSSSEASCAEEWSERSMLTESPSVMRSSETLASEIFGETNTSASECGSSSQERHYSGPETSHDECGNNEVLEDFTDGFIHWVTNGETLSC